MIKKSFKIFLTGFVCGTTISFILLSVFPGLLDLFLKLLVKKIEVQREIFPVKSLFVVISINNILAATICAYGGYIFTRLFMLFESPSSSFLKKLSLLDRRINELQNEQLKYYLYLNIFPVFVLLLNGFILGMLLVVLYSGNPLGYVRGLLPHGALELPAIILAGSVGLSIAESIHSKKQLGRIARERLKVYGFAVLLILAAGFLESNY